MVWIGTLRSGSSVFELQPAMKQMATIGPSRIARVDEWTSGRVDDIFGSMGIYFVNERATSSERGSFSMLVRNMCASPAVVSIRD